MFKLNLAPPDRGGLLCGAVKGREDGWSGRGDSVCSTCDLIVKSEKIRV